MWCPPPGIRVFEYSPLIRTKSIITQMAPGTVEKFESTQFYSSINQVKLIGNLVSDQRRRGRVDVTTHPTSSSSSLLSKSHKYTHIKHHTHLQSLHITQTSTSTASNLTSHISHLSPHYILARRKFSLTHKKQSRLGVYLPS